MKTENVSFEFFPPKTPEGADKLRAVRARLGELEPEFFSVTFGAGGSTKEGTWNTVMELHAEGRPVAPHISCIGTTRASVRELLDGYRAAGIRRLVALRGDLPSGAAGGAGDFRYANELVEFIRAETGDWFRIEVAAYPEAHPQSRSPADDLARFVQKVQAGADAAITQYFYNAGCLLPLRRRRRGARIVSAGRARASCRSPTSCSSRGFPMPAAPRSRAGSGAVSKASATTATRSAPSGSTSCSTCASACSTAAPPACTSTR